MSTRTFVRGTVAIAALALLMTTAGSATAAPTAIDPVHAAIDPTAAVPVGTAAVEAAPVSWRVSSAAVSPATVAQRPSRAASARVAQAARWASFTAFTLRSKATRDMRGVEASLYRGKYYRAALESKRRCIADRESEGHYDVVNPSGAYRGAYQVSAALARGATWMMLKEHKQLMGPEAAKKTLAKLRATPMNKWPRYWQDAAFHTVANWEGTGSGIAHWAGGRWHC